jgi:hypothetical protein
MIPPYEGRLTALVIGQLAGDGWSRGFVAVAAAVAWVLPA